MSILEIAALLLQLVVPLALIVRVAFGRGPSRAAWALDVALAAAYLLAVAVAAPWLALPGYLPWVLAGMLLAATILGARRAYDKASGSLGFATRVGIAARAGLAVVLFGTASLALSGHQGFGEPAVELAFPLRGGTYLVANGGSHELINAHLKTLTGERFRPYRGQSYAVDLVRVGSWGSRRSRLSPDGPEGFAIFGDSLLAPCAGTVIRAVDGYPDRLPPGEEPQTLEGNHVLLECGGVWVLLAHLQDGTLQVEEGDRVDVGDLLGQVGNSGRSDEPHVHLHAQMPGTQKTPFGGDPVPVTFGGRHLARNDRVRPSSSLQWTPTATRAVGGSMARWLKISGVLVGAMIAAGTVAVGIGRSAWTRGTARAIAQLGDGVPAKGPSVEPAPSRARLAEMPPPVARYFAFALPEEQPGPEAAQIRWSGEFQSRPGGGWAPFTALQHFTARPPGFVWDARIRMLPLISVRVRDGYHAGTGTMLGRVGAVVPVVDQGGTPEMAQSALARWLGEAVWLPTALLPGGPVRWEAVNDSTARATVIDGDLQASAEFHFAPTGEITRMTAMRYRDADGIAVLTPFEGRYGHYERRAGLMVPAEAEVAWELPEGRFPYWRGRPVSIAYQSLPAAESARSRAQSPDPSQPHAPE